MKGDIDSLHHAGLVVRSLDAAVATYEKLGFMFSPLSMHRVGLKPGAPVEPAGTGNRCAIFQNNFLEVAAHIIKDKYSFGIPEFLARYEGLHIICFGADDIRTVHARATRDGIAASDMVLVERNVDTLQGERMMQADSIHFPKAENPEGLVQAAQHLTREYVLQPRYMNHRNGAVSLTEVIVCVETPAMVQAKYERYTGRRGERRGQTRVVELPSSRLTIVGPDELGTVLPGCKAPSIPFMAGFTVASRDLAATRRVLKEGRIPVGEHEGRLIVVPEHACGSAVVFESWRG